MCINMLRQLGVVTVLYHPDTEVLKRQLCQIPNDVRVVFVDNGSGDFELSKVESLFGVFSQRIELLRLGRNFGIAYAQNYGIRYLCDCSHVLLLDQDSVPIANMIKALYGKFLAVAEKVPVAAIGPCLIDGRTSKAVKFHGMQWLPIAQRWPGLDGMVPCATLNSSGTLLSRYAWECTGGLDETLFIDHVDTDWSFRAIAHGFHLYGLPQAALEHAMGAGVCCYWFGKWREMPYRTPLRHYYLMRNSILLQRRKHVSVRWKLGNLLKILFTIAYFGAVGAERAQQVQYILRGLWDGVRFRASEYDR